jgi:hypothetical protein
MDVCEMDACEMDDCEMHACEMDACKCAPVDARLWVHACSVL